MKRIFLNLIVVLLFITGIVFIPFHKANASAVVLITANGVYNHLNVIAGTTVIIQWSSTGADTCTNNFGALNTTSGTYSYIAAVPGSSQTFTVSCTDSFSSNPAVCTSYYPTCFIADTLVTIADGTKKNIQDIKIGEVLKGETTNNKVLGFHRPKLDGKLYSFNGGRYFVTEEHPFKTLDGWKSINPKKTANENIGITVTTLKVGDTLITEKGNILLKSIKSEVASSDTDLYNFLLDGDHTYYADGYLVHNKDACNYPGPCAAGSSVYFCVDSRDGSAGTPGVDGGNYPYCPMLCNTSSYVPGSSACNSGFTSMCDSGAIKCLGNACAVAGVSGYCTGTVGGSKTCDGSGAPGPYENKSCTQFIEQNSCTSVGCTPWLTHGCTWIAR